MITNGLIKDELHRGYVRDNLQEVIHLSQCSKRNGEAEAETAYLLITLLGQVLLGTEVKLVKKDA